jgi:hypothetical protein
MLALTVGSHITCLKKGAIVKAVGVVEVFEFEVWVNLKGSIFK